MAKREKALQILFLICFEVSARRGKNTVLNLFVICFGLWPRGQKDTVRDLREAVRGRTGNPTDGPEKCPKTVGTVSKQYPNRSTTVSKQYLEPNFSTKRIPKGGRAPSVPALPLGSFGRKVVFQILFRLFWNTSPCRRSGSQTCRGRLPADPVQYLFALGAGARNISKQYQNSVFPLLAETSKQIKKVSADLFPVWPVLLPVRG